MSIDHTAPVDLPEYQIPAFPEPEELSPEREQELKESITRLLKQQNGVIVAHYYTDGRIQDLAEHTGGCVADSLEMARFGNQHPASTLVVAGVKFMGETAKILNNEKRVLMPDTSATCSLDESCPADEFSAFCDRHPDRSVVVYANTSAAVKARSDWVVTSGIAMDIVEHLHQQGQRLIWAPDQHLGYYVRRQTGADMILWPGSCVVHEEFSANGLLQMRRRYPDAAVLVHPESPAAVIDQADYVGSTTGLIKAVSSMARETFIVATDSGIFHNMRQAAPGKHLIEAPREGVGATCQSCARCPWMAMNTLQKLEETLKFGTNEIEVSADLARRARKPIRRMLDFAAGLNR